MHKFACGVGDNYVIWAALPANFTKDTRQKSIYEKYLYSQPTNKNPEWTSQVKYMLSSGPILLVMQVNLRNTTSINRELCTLLETPKPRLFLAWTLVNG